MTKPKKPEDKLKVGAKRTHTPQYDDLIAFGEEMVEFFEKNPHTLHINQWYCRIKGVIYKDWKAMIQKPEFIPYYERAASIVALNYVDKTSNMREGASQRFLRVYYKDVRDCEDELILFQEKVKTDSKETVSDEEIKRLEDMLESLKKGRQKPSDPVS